MKKLEMRVFYLFLIGASPLILRYLVMLFISTVVKSGDTTSWLAFKYTSSLNEILPINILHTLLFLRVSHK